MQSRRLTLILISVARDAAVRRGHGANRGGARRASPDGRC